MPSLCKRQSLRATKTFESDRCLCFQLDKHEVELGGTIKKGPRFPAPTPHSGEISTTNTFSSYSLEQSLQIRQDPFRRGQLVTLEGALRYREVEDDVEGTRFKHRITEVHATSLKRLSKIEGADDPSDGAGDE
jgi:hypothetical protein